MMFKLRDVLLLSSVLALLPNASQADIKDLSELQQCWKLPESLQASTEVQAALPVTLDIKNATYVFPNSNNPSIKFGARTEFTMELPTAMNRDLFKPHSRIYGRYNFSKAVFATILPYFPTESKFQRLSVAPKGIEKPASQVSDSSADSSSEKKVRVWETLISFRPVPLPIVRKMPPDISDNLVKTFFWSNAAINGAVRLGFVSDMTGHTIYQVYKPTAVLQVIGLADNQPLQIVGNYEPCF